MTRSRALLVGTLVLVGSCSERRQLTAEVAPVDEHDVFCDPVDALPDEGAPASATPEPLVSWVDPFIGTGGSGFSVGSAFPGPSVPFGMVKPGPDTSFGGRAARFSHAAGYSKGDDTIRGFSHFRLQGAGIADYGGVALLPYAAASGDRPRGATVAAGTERASPGHYAVRLADHGIDVELTATARVAFHRVRFPVGSPAAMVVDAGHRIADEVEVADARVTVDAARREVRGHSHVMGDYSSRYGGVRLYFVARFDRPFERHAIDGSAAVLSFGASTPTLEARVGVSFVDEAHAAMNLDAEDRAFDVARTEAAAAWETRLGRVRIEARSDRDRRIFYSALYRTQLMPTLASDVDGAYRGIEGAVHRAEGYRYFTDFSSWDTYRTHAPWISLVYPEDARDFAASLVAMGTDGGFLPRWPLGTGESGGMLGDGATIVLADTALRGVGGWDQDAAYRLARSQAITPRPEARTGGRERLAEWIRAGYHAHDGGPSVSLGLEHAAADAALGAWAARRGEHADAAMFAARGGNWKNYYDARVRLLAPRRSDGAFLPVEPTTMGGAYEEGSAWQYSLMVFHDVAGLEAQMTRPVLLGRLEQFFTRAACSARSPALPHPHYWPANEPVLSSPWMFAALGDRVRASRWLRWTTVTHFGDGPDGLPGNDDGGTMSAFYLFASLGFFPIAGTDRYVLGTPLFPRASIQASEGRIDIDAPGASRKRRFVRSVTAFRAPAGASLAHRDLVGARLSFEFD